MEYFHHVNPNRLDSAAEAHAAECIRNLAKWESAVAEIRTWPEYSPQPLHTLPNLAKKLAISQLYVKDESKRFGTGLGSFKALGAPYAVYRILADEVHKHTGSRPSAAELRTDKYRHITSKVTVCVATDGNQGRGLAYGAKVFGCRCVDYIHAHVSSGREEAMMNLGAIVIRIDDEYEASVARAKEDALLNGWHFVSSTSWTDFDHGIPQDVMNAYMMVFQETLEKLPSADVVTHMFVCGGVGSIAAALFQGFYTRHKNKGIDLASKMPRCILVEPIQADCLFQSVKNGELRNSAGTLDTMMAGLACRTPSPAAWKILSWLASDFITVSDEAAFQGMNTLATAPEGDVPVVIGESSAASVGIMVASVSDACLREKLGLDGNSQVLIFGLEGATDPVIYEQVVGLSPGSVFQAQNRFKGVEFGHTFFR
ncbi:hypothetical protein J7T55_000204 [Diaporthe amygdali]|uniref:uncharacterized protein n=1 Tax=Phomopsis amygdali TaxID=1214568 RepID=UPI0022FE2666|nr:uncharacterized protein J7T55_000204 [Diaporthe amygdali]KAJ0108239.1 hypothetical protein J7T55_000204 [Diaporthe amygdali]